MLRTTPPCAGVPGHGGELHRDWRNDIDGLGALFSNHIPDYRNLITSYTRVKNGN